MDISTTPLVNIQCTAYNHEKYIRDALEGFVMQKTNFKFEAIVHDDASTDNTAAIIQEYAEKYPDIIKPIFETENQYSKKDGSLGRIMKAAIHPNAKYIAICEGDDYWTDPYKLQKQVDFMEDHPDFSMCFHKVNIESNLDDYKHIYDHVIEKEYTSDEILNKWTIPTCSSFLKKEVFYNTPKDSRFLVGDIILFLTASKYGRIYCLPDTMGVYRSQASGVTQAYMNKIKGDDIIKYVLQFQAIKEYFPKAQKASDKLISSHMLDLIRYKWGKNKIECIKYTLLFLYQEKMPFLIILLKWFKHLLHHNIH